MDEAPRSRRRAGAFRRAAAGTRGENGAPRGDGGGPRGGNAVGRVLELSVGAPAHGGSCVARHQELVVFVRHALPGERVLARVTEGNDGDRFLRADVIEVLEPSADRVPPPCRYAGPGGCGGCDWQHANLGAQRRLKAQVLTEQLRRLAGLDQHVEVEALPGAADGSGWRTRVRFAVDAAGHPGLRRHHSHEVVAVSDCFIAHPEVTATGVLDASWPARTEVLVTITSSGQRIVTARAGTDDDAPPGDRVVESVLGRSYQVPATGFWQVHPHAATTLVEAVAIGLQPRPGEVLLDLYSGSGLFAAALAAQVAPGGRVIAVENDSASVAAARDNLADVPGVEVVADRVDRALRIGLPRADLVVLDPPRAGLGREVVEAVAARRPRRVAYVACDPATLARDLKTFAECGYRVRQLRAFDLFPHTHHLEAVAILEPTPGHDPPASFSDSETPNSPPPSVHH